MAEPPELEWRMLLNVMRSLRDWSQEDLAEVAKVSLSSITRQEGGAIPKPAVREKVEQALGIGGMAREMQLFFGSIRAMVSERGGRPWDAEEAGTVLAHFIAVGLKAALAELQKSEDESWGTTPETVKLPMGADELRRERLERLARRKRLRGEPDS